MRCYVDSLLQVTLSFSCRWKGRNLACMPAGISSK